MKTMEIDRKKAIKITKILLILSAGLLVILMEILAFNVLMQNQNWENNLIENAYTYTKAICTETNFCQDYEVVCENSELKELTPITGAVIQNEANWEDPRDIETIKRWCD